MFTLNDNYKCVDKLLRSVLDYNPHKHHTIGMRPPACITPAIAEKFLGTVYSAIKIADPAKFKMDNSIRVSKYKTVFEKGYISNLIIVFTMMKCSVPISGNLSTR